jgi:hypothetical protein
LTLAGKGSWHPEKPEVFLARHRTNRESTVGTETTPTSLNQPDRRTAMKSLLFSFALIAASSSIDSRPWACPLELPVVVSPARCFDSPAQLPRFAPASELPTMGVAAELVG